MSLPRLIPEPLKKGDIVGIIAPAGQVYDKEKFEKGIRILSEMGFVPRFPRRLWPGGGYLADRDYRRAGEFHQMMVDPEVKGIIAARGGFGCLRLLRHANLDHLRKNPKMFVGFSDITILLNRIAVQSGVISLHGPVVTSLAGSSRESLKRFYHAVTGSWSRSIRATDIEILKGGKPAEGVLLGGNLSTLTTLLGTEYDFSYDNCLLFLEDVNEPLYKVDRMLTQLQLAGKLDKICGLVIGEFTLEPKVDPLDARRYQENIWMRILELTKGMDIPVWANFPVGHARNNLTLPVGAIAVMDSKNATIYFR